jgi:hypothetical protein
LDEDGESTGDFKWQVLVNFDMNNFFVSTDECRMEIEGCELIADEISNFGWTGVDNLWSFVLDTSNFVTI